MAEEQKKTFQLQRVYLKDASFECPGAPDIFLQEWKPKMNVQLNNSARRIGEGTEYEVEVTVTVLFPYAREVVSDLVAKGSFPQMILQPLNFEALYQQQREKQQSGDGEPSTVQ